LAKIESSKKRANRLHTDSQRAMSKRRFDARDEDRQRPVLNFTRATIGARLPHCT
jgi:hypothetical protein